jgi:hypothetical protein
MENSASKLIWYIFESRFDIAGRKKCQSRKTSEVFADPGLVVADNQSALLHVGVCTFR